MLGIARATVAILALGSQAVPTLDPPSFDCVAFNETTSTTGYVSFQINNPNNATVWYYPSCSVSPTSGTSCYVDTTPIQVSAYGSGYAVVDYDMGSQTGITVRLDLGLDGHADIPVPEFTGCQI